MLRLILAIALSAVLARPAAAQPAQCVDTTASWTTPYSQGAIQAITYFIWQAPFPPTIPLLAVLFRSGEFHLHVNVPLSVAQPFTSLSNADQRYNSTVKSRYHQALLAESLCPLLNEDGNFLLGEVP